MIGVGPWDGPPPEGDHWDHDLLRDGDARNVADRYRYWTVEAIVADLDRRRHPFHVAIENWQHDFNIGSIVRTANAFLAAEVHIVGKRRWNRRGAMVTDRYQHVRHHASVEDLVVWAAAAQLPLLGIDNTSGSVPIETATLPSGLRPAVRPGGPRAQRRGPCREHDAAVDRPVRIDAVDQRRCGGGDRHARLDPGARWSRHVGSLACLE